MLGILLSIALPVAGWVIVKLNSIDRLTCDMHVWHSPDSNGRMTWKSDPEDTKELLTSSGKVIARMDRLCEKMDQQTEQSKEEGEKDRAQTRELISSIKDLGLEIRNGHGKP